MSISVPGVLLGGVIAGTIDIFAASLISGHDVIYILHTIAGGVLAKRALSGGAATAVLGAALQELMGILIALIYALGVRRVPKLADRWLVAGLLYGAIVFLVMNYVVVPLSAWHVVPQFTLQSFVMNFIAMLLFGVIVAFFARNPVLPARGKR